MVKKFLPSYKDFDTIRNLRDKLFDIEFILFDEGISYLTIDYPNRDFQFIIRDDDDGSVGKFIKYVPFRIKLVNNSELTKEEVLKSDFFNEWVDRAKELCGDKISIYTHSIESSIYITFYYN